MFIQSIINSIMLGLTYVLLTSGFSLVFGVVQILNFAHGQMYMLSLHDPLVSVHEPWINYVVGALISVLTISLLGSFTKEDSCVRSPIFSSPSSESLSACSSSWTVSPNSSGDRQTEK